jgi:hypothetical protein
MLTVLTVLIVSNVNSCYEIKLPEVTNVAEREMTIFGIKPERIYKTGNISSNVTLRGVPVIIVVVEKQELLHILSVYLYP